MKCQAQLGRREFLTICAGVCSLALLPVSASAAFPDSLECHFSTINRTAKETAVVVRIYTIRDGGLDVRGNQLYKRTLLQTINDKLAPNINIADMLTLYTAKLGVINTTQSLALTPDKFICSL